MRTQGGVLRDGFGGEADTVLANRGAPARVRHAPPSGRQCSALRRLLLGFVVLSVTVVAGCGGGEGTQASRAPASGDVRIDLHPCRIGAVSGRCGTLRVAENPSEPRGTQILLN